MIFIAFCFTLDVYGHMIGINTSIYQFQLKLYDNDYKKWQYMQKTVQKCVLRSSMQFKTTKFTFQNAKYALDIILDAVSNSDQCSTSF